MEIAGLVSRAIRSKSGDLSQVGTARRQALSLASALDFTELRCGELGIVVTEAAKNLSAHGGGGEILLTPWKSGDIAGIDMLALDQGSGIPDLAMALQDGYSTAGTPGTGLGAIERLANVFEIYSQPSKGTAVFARLLRSEKLNAAELPWFGSVVVPFGEEIVSGDGWAISFTGDRTSYVMVDGLGHGPIAGEAAQEAIRAFHCNAHLPPKQILLATHNALQKTRGAAVAIAEVMHHRKVLTYAGSGNIASSIYCDGSTRSMVSMNGTPGHNISTLQEFTYPFHTGSMLLMHSDGLLSRWDLHKYPGLSSRHPALIAGVLYRDFSRRRDDAAILVVGI